VIRPPLGRLGALFTILCLGLAAILVRLVFLQVRDASAFQSLGAEQRVRTVDLPARRGSILDRHGRELALSLDANDVYGDPQLVTDSSGTAERIAPILDLPEGLLARELARDTSFVYVARQVDRDVADRVKAMDLPGIGLLDAVKRYYPSGPMAPQTLGFVGVDGTGLEGLELEYQRQLGGRNGRHVMEIDPQGHLIPQATNLDVAPVEGDDLVTTIDREIQYRVQVALKEAVEGNHAKGGTVIVLEPHTGDILAMATYPWFDPNRFAEAPASYRTNPAIVNVYEPGSVNKLVTISAAIQEHVVKLKKRMLVPDRLWVDPYWFSDAHSPPTEPMTVGDIIAQSSNIGTIKIAHELGSTKLWDYLQRFGLTRKTEVGFPGEVGGILPPIGRWTPASMASIPIGQGVAVTPLQMAAAYSAVANDGVWVQPRLVRGMVDPAGQFHPAARPVSRRVVSDATARTLQRLLAYAVDAGTGTLAQIPGYWVGGKTGTAQIPKEHGLGYTNQYIASFIGFAPANDPQLVVAAIIDRPVTEYGGLAAAPLFKDVARFALARLRIAPEAKPPIPPHALSGP